MLRTPAPLIGALGGSMILIDTSPILYYSQLDEDAFFEWAKKLPCVASIDGGYLHIKSKRIAKSDLRDLIALMTRYELPMAQLRQFATKANARWFIDKDKYWYKAVFDINDA